MHQDYAVPILIASSRKRVGLERERQGEVGKEDRRNDGRNIPEVLPVLLEWLHRSQILYRVPYKLSLGVKQGGTDLLPFRSGSTSGGQILVTESYDTLLHRMLSFRRQGRGDTKGVVLTGQPGTGASLLPDLNAARHSPTHPSPRKNHIPEVRAHMVTFKRPGRTPP